MKETFAEGMHVRYGSTGICRIERIADIPYPGDSPTRRCYVLRPLRHETTEVTVPTDNETLCAKMHPLRNRREIDTLLAQIRDAELPPWEPDRKLRAVQFRKTLTGGNTEELLLLIRSVQEQQLLLNQNGKQLTAADDSTRKDAMRLVDEEFSFSLKLNEQETGDYILAALTAEK